MSNRIVIPAAPGTMLLLLRDGLSDSDRQALFDAVVYTAHTGSPPVRRGGLARVVDWARGVAGADCTFIPCRGGYARSALYFLFP